MNVFASMVAQLAPKAVEVKPKRYPHPRLDIDTSKPVQDRIIDALRKQGELTEAGIRGEAHLTQKPCADGLRTLLDLGTVERWRKQSNGPFWYRLAREGA